MSIDRIHISERGRHELIVLKRRTGLRQWNHLCRWALCVSLADPTTPPDVDLGATGVELTWQTFGGAEADIYEAMFRMRCHRDGVDPADRSRIFHLHLHRGIARLYAVKEVRSMADFIEVARKLCSHG
ncbi:DNA sulfur modification protein DndE [Persicimonas caeni]|uniref:DNA sulfur modification protein DndE n=1 Tax=Persicimonas caeni TaxID=2292766 RepID=A0A4Y6PQW3_PERCE|nr:DNA sulfur modification protein DndE [Persicimonas caeni]QDG50509.1 DNA sulfur modification protein DndE [Persicimonas caeni]QED31730.1 DNA sulfur modification protein DndE [Persicimonas caeni]